MNNFDWNNLVHVGSGIVVAFVILKAYGKRLYPIWTLFLAVSLAWLLNIAWELIADTWHLLPAFIPVAHSPDWLDPVRAVIGAVFTWLVRVL
jgi:hypothetical protein